LGETVISPTGRNAVEKLKEEVDGSEGVELEKRMEDSATLEEDRLWRISSSTLRR